RGTMPTYNFRVNDQPVSVDAPADLALLWVLRDKLGITGPKYGCGVNVCKACTCLVNNQAVQTCVTPVSSVAGKRVTTIGGPRRRRHATPGPAGVARTRCTAMRVLPAGPDHERRRAVEGETKPERRRHRRDREHVPVRDLRPDSPGDQECGGRNVQCAMTA